MTDAHPDNTYGDDEIDLRELFLVLWEGKALITMVTGLAAIVSVVCGAINAQYLSVNGNSCA